MADALKNFGALRKDSNHESIPFGGAFVTQDATGTPKTSPLAYSSSVITLTVPANAVKLVVLPTTDMRISDVSNAATYDVVPANTRETYDVANMSAVYIVRDASDGSLRFRFITV